MDCRKAVRYVSCIKIHGVPILPPLMTQDIRMEMMYYKQLAIAVEKRLKNLEYSQVHSKRIADLAWSNIITPEESTSESIEKNVNLAKSIDIPDEKLLSDKPKPNMDNPTVELRRNTGDATRLSRKSFSDDESNYQNDATTSNRTASSDGVTASADIDRFPNGSLNSESATTTMENSPESRKLRVPKTLNIVPITVDSLVQSDTTVYEIANDTRVLDNNKESPTSPESEATTPKLVRQGSYVVENPSPMLLAHLEDEIMCANNYVPTAATNNAVKRKEWNIIRAKSEWELQRRNEKFVATHSSRGTPNRIRRNSASSASSKRGNTHQCQSRSHEKYLAGTRQVARSADCIRSMICRENNLANSKSLVNEMNAKEFAKSVNRPSNIECARSASILNLANKLGGSLGCLSGTENRSYKGTSQKPRDRCRLSKSFDKDIADSTKSESIRDSTRKLLTTVTSDKLLHVFKEIQTTHERQMIELMTRQRKEQQMMRKEFEKQQLLLFAQIEQSFPGICLPRLAEKVPMTPQSPYNEGDSPDVTENRRERTDTPPKSIAMNGSHSPTECPLDDIYPRELSGTSSTYKMKYSQSAQTLANNKTTSPPIGLYSTFIVNGDRRHSGVSRQLFPLESKTRRVPVLINILYEDRHIKAATVITAYARGYLVRRLMQTERVIELKTTYKEALHCMLKLHVDAPLALPELNFHQRLRLQCDAASMNIVELFAQAPAKRMEIIEQDRQIKRARQERPNSARSTYSFATQRTLARKKLKEMGDFETPAGNRPITARSRCQTWASNVREKRSPSLANRGIKRSTSAGAVRKPWR